MRKIIYSLPDQILETIKLVPKGSCPQIRKYEGVLVCGMGGSGISGEILGAIYPEIPIISNKDYTIPKYIGKKTLSILISYSGNTEETLSNYKILYRNKNDMVLVSSDGKLLKKEAGYKIKVPGGLPPRGALGYLFTALPIILYEVRVIKHDPRKELSALVKFLKSNRDDVEKKAKNFANYFIDRLPIIYTNSATFLPVANRWRCQLNENSKILAHINVLPEMNHNEIVGLGGPKEFNQKILLVFINDPEAHRRNKIRVKIVKKIIKDDIRNTIDINPRGKNNLQRLFWTIMLGDFISYYLASKTNVDPTPVKRIDYLKKRLATYR